MAWLEMQYVVVRRPLVYGSRKCFEVGPDDSFEGEDWPSKIRAMIDDAMADDAKATGGAS